MHQLNFCVTVQCGSFEALHKIEHMLNLKGAGALFLGQPLFNIVDRSYRGELGGFEVEIHSVDINEDAEKEPVLVCSKCLYENYPGFDTRPGWFGEPCACCSKKDVQTWELVENVEDEDPFDIDSFSDGEERFNRMLERKVKGTITAEQEALPEQVTFVKRPTSRWMPIGKLAPGSLFETKDGTRAVKSEYHLSDGNCECVLVGSGEYAHFSAGDKTMVKVLICEEDDIPF